MGRRGHSVVVLVSTVVYRSSGCSNCKFLNLERAVKTIRSMAFLALFALLALTGSAISQPATISWPDAVSKISGERAKAETCVALMKKYGDDTQIARSQLTYANAKADSDALIAGLITALSAGQAPARPLSPGHLP